MTLFVLDAAHVHLVGTVHEVDGRKAQERQPIARVRHQPRGDRRRAGADEVARRTPEKIHLPGGRDAFAGRQGDGRRHETRVEQEVRRGGADERTRERHDAQFVRSTAERVEGQTGALHRDHQRSNAEECSMKRIAILVVQVALAERAAGGHEHRFVRAEQQQRGEIHRIRDRHGRAAGGQRQRDLERRAGRREYQQRQEDHGLVDARLRQAADEQRHAREDHRADIETTVEGQLAHQTQCTRGAVEIQ